LTELTLNTQWSIS